MKVEGSKSMSFFKEMLGLGKELGGILSDGRKEFTEIMTDGFKEMVIKNNNDYKTSFEKNDEARLILSGAKSRYKSRFDEVYVTYTQVKNVVESHFAYKVDLYHTYEQHYASIIEKNIQILDIKKKEIELLYVDHISHNILNSSFMNSSSRTGALFYDFQLQQIRVNEADANLDEAKAVRARLDMEGEKLKQIQINLQFVEASIQEERRLIEKLSGALERKIDSFESIIHTNSHYKELEECIDIIKMFEKIIKTQFLQDEAKITQQYKKILLDMTEMEKRMITGSEH